MSVTVQTLLKCTSRQCEYDVDKTQGSVGSCETQIFIGLRCESVAHAEVCDVARLCPRPGAAGGGSDGAEIRIPDAAGRVNNFAPFVTGVLLFARVPKANQLAAIESKG